MSEAAEAGVQRAGTAIVSAPDPVVPANAEFSGLVHVRGAARIDGRVDGEVVAAGTVWIGETARVRARVEARTVIVAGALEGEVRATQKIELLPTARVAASLETPRLVLADGSFFEGRCCTGGGVELPGPDAPRPAISPPRTP